ncbi:hypothetical protein IFR04_014786 [Cadophora malorum]|uniref:Uncharacterized protein n=1 Tax=Cadophora malorum TaxID=108018 RepID=A0A8H7T473_9HELO|nr:hypothetical protein IFR04_014786 [Cadophora malorum]
MRTALNPTFYWEGKMPALVIALRPLKISDGHVLEWWYGYDLSDWEPIELSLIKTLEVELSDLAGYMNDVYNEETHSWEWGLKKPNLFTDFLQSATNLREVHLRIDLDNSVNQFHVAPFITQWPLWLEGCTALSAVMYVKQIGDRFQEERERWVWEAPAGKVVNGAQIIGREWHHVRSRYSSWGSHNKVGNILDQVHNIRLEERSDGIVLEEDAED